MALVQVTAVTSPEVASFSTVALPNALGMGRTAVTPSGIWMRTRTVSEPSHPWLTPKRPTWVDPAKAGPEIEM